MTTQQMEYFLALAQKLSFSAVAERFFISQPTLSRQISSMESELGAQLFIRKNNTVYLTQAGERLYAGLKDIYGSYQELTRQVEDLARNRAGTLHIGVAEEQQISPELLLAIRALHAQRPNVEITIRRGRYDQLRNGLPDQLTCRELEGLFQDIPLLLPEGDGFAPPKEDPVGDLERNMGFAQPLRRVMMVQYITAMPLYVAAGLGAAITNRTALLGAEPDVRMIPILDGPVYPKIAAYRSLDQNPLMNDLVKLMETD